ncbi:E3 ubiquitin-protein ligase highwire [Balamuthia mandrillaris]
MRDDRQEECPLCQAHLSRHLLWRHLRQCVEETSHDPEQPQPFPYRGLEEKEKAVLPLEESLDAILETQKEEEKLWHARLEEKQRAKEEELRRKQEERERQNSPLCPICQIPRCVRELHFSETCPHFYCVECLHTSIIERIDNHNNGFTCPIKGCDSELSQAEIRDVLSESEFEAYLRQTLEDAIEGNSSQFLRCPNPSCSDVIERLEPQLSHSPAKIALGPKGVPLSKEADLHMQEYRFRCRSCDTEFCAGCKASPYHLGMTCEQHRQWTESKRCRFCATQVTKLNSIDIRIFYNMKKNNGRADAKSAKGKERTAHGQEREVMPPGEHHDAEEASNGTLVCCNSVECQLKNRASCRRLLPCNHPCGGIRDESSCLDCLQPSCQRDPSAQRADDYCVICYVESLGEAPCIQLECGHVFHFNCVKNKIRNGWPGSRITFGFLDCALCKYQIKHPALEEMLAVNKKLYKEVSKKALQRLQILGLENCHDIVSPDGRFYGDALGYALHRFSFYLCFKCKKPFFGGDKACDGALQDRDFNPEELVCGSCCDLRGVEKCPKHGTKFLEYKCRYCCNVAVWFCWGTTHFCDECHKKAAKLIHMRREDLPECCCNAHHPPNGEEFSLGCSYCRTINC